MLTQQRLKELLDYNPETGDFTWKVRRKGVKVGKPAGSVHNAGYLHFMVDGKQYLNHRLAVLWMTGKFPEDGMDVDHINQNKKDNRWSNLRVVTRSINMQNKDQPQANSKTGIRGVSRYKDKFAVEITANGQRVYRALYDTLAEAHQASIAMKHIHHHPGSTI